MGSKQTTVLLLLLIAILSLVLLLPPTETTQQPETPDHTLHYGISWEKRWEQEGTAYDYNLSRNWLSHSGDVWKNIETSYGTIAASPVISIHFGQSVVVYVKHGTSIEEMNRIYTWIDAAAQKAGVPDIPVEFNSCGKLLTFTKTGVYTFYECSGLTGGTATEIPGGQIRSLLLVLCIAGVAVLGFSRMLELPKDPASRPQRIADFIAEHPGCSQKEIMDTTEFSRGSVLYNLVLLKRNQIIREVSYYGNLHYFPRKDDDSAMERTLRAARAQKTTADVLREIAESPGIGAKELAKRIGIAKTTLAWHLRRLSHAKIITRTSGGWALTPEAEEVWDQLNS
ncbi:MAG: winged helix-turn-helix transcriptional regulator [Methanocorpusculum sp.]|nr:winged helix-turn-helix transcriptional regulator [Methanocorpusculum sp.]